MYIINEMQTGADGAIAFLPPITKEKWNEAESEFYIKVGYAAISQVWKHTVTLDDESGKRYKAKCYKHVANRTEEVVDTDTEPEGE